MPSSSASVHQRSGKPWHQGFRGFLISWVKRLDNSLKDAPLEQDHVWGCVLSARRERSQTPFPTPQSKLTSHPLSLTDLTPVMPDGDTRDCLSLTQDKSPSPLLQLKKNNSFKNTTERLPAVQCIYRVGTLFNRDKNKQDRSVWPNHTIWLTFFFFSVQKILDPTFPIVQHNTAFIKQSMFYRHIQ